MGKDKKFGSGGRKGFSGSFFLFLFAIFLVVMGIQSWSGAGKGKVSFSYQLEHLMNLHLIRPEENKKIAQNDNLVTFSGKFREIETKEGKEHFKYLDLLYKNQELKRKKQILLKNLSIMQKSVVDATGWYFILTGKKLPQNGFIVVDSVYDTPQRNNSVILKTLPEKRDINLREMMQQISQMKVNPNVRENQNIDTEMGSLLQLFRSTRLGIGLEPLKQKLKELQGQVSSIENDKNISEEKKLVAYESIVIGLEKIAQTLEQKQKGVRFLPLRSVRSYLEGIDNFNIAEQELEKNEALLQKARQSVAHVIWFFNNQEISTRSLEKQDSDIFAHWFYQAKEERENFLAANKGLVFKAPDQPRNVVLEKKFKSEEPTPNYFSYIFTLLPIILVVLVLYFIFSKQMKGAGSSAMNFGKSPARLLTKEENKVTFADVAGAEEAKEELSEIVEFLKDPQKFTSLGARIPKGVLLVGPPGTGKTLVAKAVAGEADRPFFSISGSDFVEMFVGVGASRIRDLFDQAKKNAPCIIFMDEIDAVGRHRGAGIGGGHDEREQTLNQLLVEMDGFDTKEGVILMAATNRPDILDRALLRPGRFDRRVMLDLPDVKGRYEILKVHARKIKIDPSVELMDIARNTPGSSGADLENVLNESALLAARRNRSAVTQSEIQEACDKVRFGKERRSLEIDENEKKTTSYHESGHAIVGLYVDHSDPIDKVTIIPRGFALGATHFMPKKNRLSYWKREVIDQLAILMGGRAAEEIFIDDSSSGAQQDIQQATKLARSMVCEWGMSDNLGTISYDEKLEGGQYLGMGGYHEKMYSDETAKKIDKEVFDLVEKAHKRAREIVEKNKDKVQLMAEMLMEFETLDAKDIQDIMQDTWNIEEKRKRLKTAEDLQKKSLPPPIPSEKKQDLFDEKDPHPQQT